MGRFAVVLVILGLSAGIANADCKFSKPVALADKGEGWLVPPTWSHRGLRFGTGNMIGLIQRAARRVAKGKPGATLYVGDISLRRGGATEWHKSHKCGRDADLLFYAVRVDGKQPRPPAQMIPFDSDGVAWVDGEKVVFDTARNWLLVKAIVEDRVRIEKLFIHASLRKKLLAYARQHKESEKVIARAAELMSQPGDAGPHDDHLHVRIAADQPAAPMKKIAKASTKTTKKHRHVEARPSRRRRK